MTNESVLSTGKVGTRVMEYYNKLLLIIIILGAASKMTNESVPSTVKQWRI